MRSPAPPELAAGRSIADWDLAPLTFYVALPSMLRETLTLDRDVTVGKVKEIIEFLTLIGAGAAPLPLRNPGVQKTAGRHQDSA